ncbi:MAG TPA: lipase maturation factor family protein [Polyangiales bacterium]
MAAGTHQSDSLPFYRPGCAADPGPTVARVFTRALALVCAVAWLSLATQVTTLIGEHGLLPAHDVFARAQARDASFWQLPSLLWLAHSDGWLVGGCLLGIALSMLAAFGVRSRLCLLLNAPLYLGYVVAGGSFMSFQWDNMLIEVCVLCAFLPGDRKAPYAAFALRLLLFKLYLESGIAKWQSAAGDWQDGSAMSFYYETAPIPTRLAWYAHHLPSAYHHFESWAALFMELVVPFCVLGPRRARLFAFAYFTLFLLLDTATANYGFFTYLSACLHLFLLNDTDVERARQWLRLPARPARAPSDTPAQRSPEPVQLRSYALGAALAAWIAASLNGAVIQFSKNPVENRTALQLYARLQPLRVANVYHLFGQITRARFEAEFQTQVDGQWLAQPLHYKPGPVDRAPPFVAPHQPRVDFQLWFYGLSFQGGMPSYVSALLDRLCEDPARVQSLFAQPLPAAPDAVRIMFHRYHFSSWAEHVRSGAYWTREELGVTAPRQCR